MVTIAHRKAHGAIALLNKGERDAAAEMLADSVRLGPSTGLFWKSVATLAERIGEIEISIEASRRFSRTDPMLLSRYLHYWSELAKFGRETEAVDEITRLPLPVQEHLSVLHFRGQIAAQSGDFEGARNFYHRALAIDPSSPLIWFALGAITDFAETPALLDRMREVEPTLDHAESVVQARFQYGLGRAYHDLGDYNAAMSHYQNGARIRRAEEAYDRTQMERYAAQVLAEFTPKAFERLTPPTQRFRKSIFVNGLPRSGTTLIQQILTSNDRVADGGEISLFNAAITPAGDGSLAGALRYQQSANGGEDPWGKIGFQYGRMLKMRFRTDERVVDKTLLHSRIMGLLLHTLPDCPIIWMRRSPSDVALSCFRNYFSDSLPWSWSLGDIGHFMAIEDRLFEHWTNHFPDRIFVVPYEDLVADPTVWIARLCEQTGLEKQPRMEHFYTSKQTVRTASLQQIRQPIGKDRIGLSDRYRKWMTEFWSTYEAR